MPHHLYSIHTVNSAVGILADERSQASVSSGAEKR